MTVTFFTNFLIHHQTPLGDEMYKLLGDNYKMVIAEKFLQVFIDKGYPVLQRPYAVHMYESEEKVREVWDLAINSDIAIFGWFPQNFMRARLELGKPTFWYGERLFKVIGKNLLHISFWKEYFKSYTKYRKSPFYCLGAGAYIPLDMKIINAFPKKCIKWGYISDWNGEALPYKQTHKEDGKIKMVFCASLEPVKRVELIIGLAKRLKELNYDFEINIIGRGRLKDWLYQEIEKNNLKDVINHTDTIPNSEVINQMRKNDLFLFTSDSGEGWGVVLNEAMSVGMPVVVSSGVGAAPHLIRHKENGLMFRNRDLNDFVEKVRYMCDNFEERARMGDNAFKTMKEEWSPEVTAQRLVHLCKTFHENGAPALYESGPGSKANLILWPSVKL